jgi:hypothetical protein
MRQQILEIQRKIDLAREKQRLRELQIEVWKKRQAEEEGRK